MKTYIFLYNEVPLCEFMLVSSLGNTGCETELISEKRGNISTNEGMQIATYKELSEIELEKDDAFLLCGGNVGDIEDMDGLKAFINKAHENGAIIGGICAGADIAAEALAYAYEGTHTEVFAEQVVLSPGSEYADFAQEFGRVAGIYSDEADYLGAVRYFRNSQIGNNKIWKKEIAKVS